MVQLAFDRASRLASVFRNALWERAALAVGRSGVGGGHSSRRRATGMDPVDFGPHHDSGSSLGAGELVGTPVGRGGLSPGSQNRMPSRTAPGAECGPPQTLARLLVSVGYSLVATARPGPKGSGAARSRGFGCQRARRCDSTNQPVAHHHDDARFLESCRTDRRLFGLSRGRTSWVETLWKGWLRVEALLEGVHLASHLRL